MWELDCEESWALKNWCFWTVVLERTLESPLDCKEIQPVRSEGDQPWAFFGRNDAKAETPILWPPHAKSWLIGRLWCWEELGAGGEGDDRGWDGWMASPTWCTWVWVNSGSWWWTGRPGVLQSMGSQRVRHDLATEDHEVIMVDSNPMYWCSYKKRRLGHKTHSKWDYVTLSEKEVHLQVRKRGLKRNQTCWPLISDFQISELW